MFCYDDGRPMGSGKLSRKFVKWRKEHGVADVGQVDFHSIRISSTSLKLAVSGGDIESAQKDLADKTTHMVLSTDARSLNKQHVAMNEKFDEFFYGDAVPESTAHESFNNGLLMQMMAKQLKKPEFLKMVLKAMNTVGTSNANKAE